jgi:hypothetical protein
MSTWQEQRRTLLEQRRTQLSQQIKPSESYRSTFPQALANIRAEEYRKYRTQKDIEAEKLVQDRELFDASKLQLNMIIDEISHSTSLASIDSSVRELLEFIQESKNNVWTNISEYQLSDIRRILSDLVDILQAQPHFMINYQDPLNTQLITTIRSNLESIFNLMNLPLTIDILMDTSSDIQTATQLSQQLEAERLLEEERILREEQLLLEQEQQQQQQQQQQQNTYYPSHQDIYYPLQEPSRISRPTIRPPTEIIQQAGYPRTITQRPVRISSPSRPTIRPPTIRPPTIRPPTELIQQAGYPRTITQRPVRISSPSRSIMGQTSWEQAHSSSQNYPRSIAQRPVRPSSPSIQPPSTSWEPEPTQYLSQNYPRSITQRPVRPGSPSWEPTPTVPISQNYQRSIAQRPVHPSLPSIQPPSTSWEPEPTPSSSQNYPRSITQRPVRPSSPSNQPPSQNYPRSSFNRQYDQGQ